MSSALIVWAKACNTEKEFYFKYNLLLISSNSLQCIVIHFWNAKRYNIFFLHFHTLTFFFFFNFSTVIQESNPCIEKHYMHIKCNWKSERQLIDVLNIYVLSVYGIH